MTHIQEKIEQYIDSRLSGKTGYLGYYDRTARRMKRRHLQNRAAAAIGAVLIPVVSNLPWEIPFGSTTIQVSTMGASLIGLGVALILALEGVFHFKEQWQNCRGTEQYLLSQRFRFENRVDEYQTLTDEEAFKLFVSKVEKAIIDENNVTLNILGRSDAASAASSK
jgi:hypothetical protein